MIHYDQEVEEFFDDYFAQPCRRCLVIGGAGFDPRSASIVRKLSEIMDGRLTAFMFREERPDPHAELVRRAEDNLRQIESYCQNLVVREIQIFAPDNAVVGGHRTVEALNEIDYSDITDIVIDLSALSLGIGFTAACYIYQRAESTESRLNVHLSLLSNPALDQGIKTEPNDVASEVRGFDIGGLIGGEDKAVLWLPVLTASKQHVLHTIHKYIAPDDTCPILPFPSRDPKMGDEIAYQVFKSVQSDFGGPLENDWALEPQNFLYSDERLPLDIYRSILRIADDREEVFEAFGGSKIILSPLGSKIPAIGALMAALERQFPVVYVEALSYTVDDWAALDSLKETESKMTHVWLAGDAYHNAV
ncbi:hypothetical protein [Pseudohalioglobus lutimaris]|uniref:hypothetical protein n=1 Tax=Pseudohalioglobus lutimaris TaxID=1737061 RepID=UPI001055009C|nr:hypothetical protein [Pseudohalioglobus lutimaris]